MIGTVVNSVNSAAGVNVMVGGGGGSGPPQRVGFAAPPDRRGGGFASAHPGECVERVFWEERGEEGVWGGGE
jgi:hypothetical protein